MQLKQHAALLVVVSACVQQPAPIGERYNGTQAPNQYQPPHQASPFAGTFTYEENGTLGTLALQQLPDGSLAGSFTFDGIRVEIQGYVQNNQLVATFLDPSTQQRSSFTAVVEEPYLVMTDDGKQYRLARGGAQQHGTQPSEPPAPPPAPPPEDLPPALEGKVATGIAINDAIDGWSAKAPAGWKTVSNRIVQNPTKTAKIYVRFWMGINLQGAITRIETEMTKATRVGGVANTRVPAGAAVVLEMNGSGTNRMRAIMIQGKEGVAEVLLETTVSELDALREAADSVARTLKFVTPDRGKLDVADSCYRNFRAVNGSSVERTLGLDGKGHARWGGWVGAHTVYESYSGKHLGDDIRSWEGDPDEGLYGIQGDTLIVHWNDAQISNFKIRWDRGRVGVLVLGRDTFGPCD